MSAARQPRGGFTWASLSYFLPLGYRGPVSRKRDQDRDVSFTSIRALCKTPVQLWQSLVHNVTQEKCFRCWWLSLGREGHWNI